MEKFIKTLKRRLARLEEQKAEYETKYIGNESDYNFYGGQNLGYVQGKISEIEDTIDSLEELQTGR